ncbi:MAG TPA: hypothetical protein VI256_10430 [Roseiarcus sp.]
MTQDTLTKDIEVSREGAVMSAAFARSQKKNAITGAMYEALSKPSMRPSAIPKSAPL